MKTNVLRFISTVLVLSICLTILPSFPAFAQEPFVQTVIPIDPEYISLQQLQTMVLPEEDRPEAIESYLVEQKGHVLRLRELEEDLNTIVFQNRDGNKTLYYFDQPVKYVDKNGNIKDKKTTVTSVIDKAEYSADYGFVTSDNDIKTYFPKKLVGDKGVLVEYQDMKIELIALSAEKNISLSAEKKQNQVDSQTRDSVEYNKAFGNNTLLKYTPTFGGFKEDIILSSYTGKNEFSFKIKTNGLALVCEDGKYYLADPATNEKLMQVGDIVVYDGSMVPNTTPSVPVLNPVKPEAKELTEEEQNALYFPEGPLDPVYEHYYQLETVKENEEYILTIVVDENYLTCEDTVYPVTIDPSLTVVGSSFADTTIYTNYIAAQGGALNMFVGDYTARYGGTKGVARALIRFPGLFSNSSLSSLTSDDIIYVDFMLRDTMCEGDAVWIDCYLMTQSWSEAFAAYSSSLWNGYVDLVDDAYVQYNGGTGSNGTGTGHWYHFDITNVVKEWLDGYYGGASSHYGLMLRAFDETNAAKTFGTSENADYPPKVLVDYNDGTSGGDDGGDDGGDSGGNTGSTAVTSVEFSQDEYVVPVGWSGTFDVIVNPEGAVSGGFNWVLVGSHDIATLNLTTGVFTALAEGTKTLVVGAKNGGTGDSCTVRIFTPGEDIDEYSELISSLSRDEFYYFYYPPGLVPVPLISNLPESPLVSLLDPDLRLLSIKVCRKYYDLPGNFDDIIDAFQEELNTTLNAEYTNASARKILTQYSCAVSDTPLPGIPAHLYTPESVEQCQANYISGIKGLASLVAFKVAAMVNPFDANGNIKFQIDKYSKFYNPDGSIKWPENDGFLNNVREKATLKPGDIIDRYGKKEGGRFASPVNTPYSMRSLPPGTDIAKPYYKFEVLKEIEVESGLAAPYFYEPGGGIQYKFYNTIEYYVENGYLKEITG